MGGNPDLFDGHCMQGMQPILPFNVFALSLGPDSAVCDLYNYKVAKGYHI